MEERKVVRFQLDNGEWRSRVYYPKSEKDENKEDVARPPKLNAKPKSEWQPHTTLISMQVTLSI